MATIVRIRRTRLSGVNVLRIALGIFFVVLGFSGIIPQAGEGVFSLSRDRTTLEIIFGLAEMACGIFLLLDAFRPIAKKTSVTVLVAILVIWLAHIVLVRFVHGIDFRSSGMVFRPDFWSWLLAFATELVIAGGLWSLYKAE